MTWLPLICISMEAGCMSRSGQPFFYDIATHHKTRKVQRWLKKHKCDRFEIHANFTCKWQLVDVALAVKLFFYAPSEFVACVCFLRRNTKIGFTQNGVTGCWSKSKRRPFALSPSTGSRRQRLSLFSGVQKLGMQLRSKTFKTAARKFSWTQAILTRKWQNTTELKTSRLSASMLVKSNSHRGKKQFLTLELRVINFLSNLY